MSTQVASGTLTADGTEQTLASPTAVGTYRLTVDLSAMVASDSVRIRANMKVLSGGTNQTTINEVISDAQVAPDIIRHSMIVVAPQGMQFTFQQTAGTNHQYPYWVDKISNITVKASGTLTLDGTEQTLTTQTANDEYVLLTDHDAQVGGDTVVVRIKVPVLSGGTARVIEQLTLTGAQALPDILRQSIPIISPHSISVTVEKTAGVNHNIPWALVTLG
jgi:hypothetical protein